MKLDTQDAGFVAAAVRWLADLPNATVADFSAVVSISPGYFPTTLHDLWLAEVSRRSIEPVDGPLTSSQVVTLPVGHPLDYDWRFTEATRATLVATLRKLTAPEGHLVYFGTPTLFIEARETLPDRRHYLVDSNEAMVRSLQASLGRTAAIRIRLGEESLPPSAAADALILDPPWYPDASKSFLVEASKVVRPRGYVLLSQPTLATRPGVGEERLELVELAKGLGLSLVRIESGALRYLTPHFERMTLGDAKPGIDIPDDWRPGDLFVFQRVRIESESVAGKPRDVLAEKWREVSFGPVRIKLRSAGSADLGELAPGLRRLTTVSRRDPLRAEVGFWTSGNRVRSLVSMNEIARLIELCDDDLNELNFTHQRTNMHGALVGLETRVAEALFDILLLEYQEHTASGYGALR